MCGIAGIIGVNGTTFEYSNAIAQMASAMKHRGPDDEGYLLINTHTKKQTIAYGHDTKNISTIPKHYRPSKFISDTQAEPYDIFLAHRRLSIIDLKATGHQPMISNCQRYSIIYNGEIYNYKLIAEELKKEGVQFTSTSDTEVILYAYMHWGVDCLQKFNGMFAFAIYDKEEQSFFFARDRMGIKPFYYTIQNGKFIFASDIKTIIASKVYKAEVNLEGLYHAMSYGAAPRPMTCFENVFALEQSHWMKLQVHTGKIIKKSYWSIPINQQQDSMTEQDASELLDSKLTSAVRLRLISDVPVGTFMSGGIDSTTISAIAAKNHPNIKAFTLGFTGKEAEYLNEIPEATATAQMYDMDHIIHRQKPEAILGEIDACVEAYEEPFFSLSPNLIISKLVANNNTKVVLNGLGGDELFAGYNSFKLGKKFSILKILLPFLKIASNFYPKYQRALDLQHVKSVTDYHGALKNNMSSHEKNKLFISDTVKDIVSLEKIRELYLPKDAQFSDFIEAMCYMYMMNYIGNHHVYRVDQFTMKYSIEGRLPFLDHNVVETAFKIPSKYKLVNNTGKYILRKVAEKHIHHSSLSMKKKGFDLPMDYWIRNTLSHFVKEKLQSLSQRDLFNRKEINNISKAFNKNYCDDYTFWQLIGIELWLEKFIDC